MARISSDSGERDYIGDTQQVGVGHGLPPSADEYRISSAAKFSVSGFLKHILMRSAGNPLAEEASLRVSIWFLSYCLLISMFML